MAFNDVDHVLALRLSIPTKSNSAFPAHDDYFRQHMERGAEEYFAGDYNADCLDSANDVDLLFKLSPSDRLQRLARNPAAATEFFQVLFDGIVECLFGVKSVSAYLKTPGIHTSERQGIFGTLSNFDSNIEANGKGTLHGHGTASGPLSPAVISSVAHSPVLSKTVTEILNSMVYAQVSAKDHLEHLVSDLHKVPLPSSNFSAQIPIVPIDDASKKAFKARVSACASSIKANRHLRLHTDSCVRCNNPCCRYAMPQGTCDCSGIRQISEVDNPANPKDLRCDDFVLTIPEPLPPRDFTREPIDPIDGRPLACETFRPTILLTNNEGMHETAELQFDILDCLESPELHDVNPAIKDKIRALSREERDHIKELLFKANGWITEFNDILMAVATCNQVVICFTVY